MACCGDRDKKTGEARPGCVLCRIWKIITRKRKSPDGDPCVNFPGHLIRKPDPCIYSQFLLMQLGKPVTWDNPDVRIFLGGVEQYTYGLTVATEYDLEIAVHNSSRDKPALSTIVDVHWIEFGAGAQTRHSIAVVPTDVPIWPGISIVKHKWRTPDLPGHYCIEVELSHPNDANPSNNLGWNNTEVYAAHSQVNRPIRIFNRYPDGCPPVAEGGGPYLQPHRALAGWGVIGAVASILLLYTAPFTLVERGARELFLVVGAYILFATLGMIGEALYAWLRRRGKDPDNDAARQRRISCNLVETAVDSYAFADQIGKDFDPNAAFQGKPPTWPARVEPVSFLFQAGEAFRDVALIIDAPDGPGPQAVFNVNVWQGGVPSGGATVTVTREGGG